MRDGWHPVLRAKKLGRKPVRITLFGKDIVVFRTPSGALGALRDMCPHRFASLSKGRINGESIACPYHGWQFSTQGQCTHIPLAQGPARQRTTSFDIVQSGGLIFVSKDKSRAGPPPIAVWDDQPRVERLIESRAHATLADAAENVLDPVHTLFVHRGLIRGASGPTSTVRIRTRVKEDAVEMRFDGEEAQNGLLSRLLEGPRSHAIGRFRMPGVVDLEYWGPARLNLVTTLYFSEVSDTNLMGFARMTGPRQGGFGVLKACLFLPIMRKVIAQDRAVMDEATTNWCAAGRPKPAHGPIDLIRPYLDHVIAGGTEADAPAPSDVTLAL